MNCLFFGQSCVAGGENWIVYRDSNVKFSVPESWLNLPKEELPVDASGKSIEFAFIRTNNQTEIEENDFGDINKNSYFVVVWTSQVRPSLDELQNAGNQLKRIVKKSGFRGAGRTVREVTLSEYD